MTMGPDSFGGGPAKPADERFTGQPSGNYRPGAGRRESGPVLPVHRPGDDLVSRNGSAAGIDRVGSGIDAAAPIASSLAVPTLAEPVLDQVDPRPEPGQRGDVWLGPAASMADHPLLRGLLLELPPKGSVPPQEWLDRWFEAARSILELLYAQD